MRIYTAGNTGHVDDILAREHLSGVDQASALLDVTGQDDHIGSGHSISKRRKCPAFEVEVAVDEEFHVRAVLFLVLIGESLLQLTVPFSAATHPRVPPACIGCVLRGHVTCHCDPSHQLTLWAWETIASLASDPAVGGKPSRHSWTWLNTSLHWTHWYWPEGRMAPLSSRAIKVL